LQRAEAGAFFQLGGRPNKISVSDRPWKITVVDGCSDAEDTVMIAGETSQCRVQVDVDKLKNSLNYIYPHLAATAFPSKQTATQLKGRQKDQEAAENTEIPKIHYHNWRKPSFAQDAAVSATSFGNAVHGIMQYICYEKCMDLNGVKDELQRLANSDLLDKEMVNLMEPEMIWRFFDSPMGRKVRSSDNVLREFKFSILDDASYYESGLRDDKILLQGVVDCALIEPEGITVLDFKTDKVSSETIHAIADSYKIQVQTYARALSKIFQRDILSSQLYFFRTGTFIEIL
jgi:ATP-dependent helicase/nuclease subunit A